MKHFILLLLLLLFCLNFEFATSQACFRDIDEDICPQREGFDEECDRRCAELYPMRISSVCRTRQTGTLLSFFGIRSFVCTCHLSPIACANPQFAIHPYFSAVVQQHSYLTQIMMTSADGSGGQCGTPSSLSCRDSFQYPSCSWKYSKEFQWFSAQSNGSPAPRESPVGVYLAGASNSGATWTSISTCDGLCSKTSVNFTARVWRAPTAIVELCFKEKETTMCAPVHSSNGHLINEIIPETDYFQIMLRFSNVSAGEMVLIDDLTVKYEACQSLNMNTIHSEEVKFKPQQSLASSIHNVPHRMCLDGECSNTHSASHIVSDSSSPASTSKSLPSTTTISASASSLKLAPNHHTKMCIGRPGLAYCRQKCNALDASESSARCIRQKENPLVKKCICHVRRSPVKKIEGPTKIPTTAENKKKHESTTMMSTPIGGSRSHEIDSNKILADETVSMMTVPTAPTMMMMETEMGTTEEKTNPCDDTSCNLQCSQTSKNSNNTVIGKCGTEPGECECRPQIPENLEDNECIETTCSFEKDSKCGWADLRMLSRHFNNISVAMKKGDENRYGISRLRPKSYSGLLYKSNLIGPITMSIDIFPSHDIDVRICVQNLRKCQTQTIAARSWNRVSAKIKVQKTEKIFVLFYNSSDDPKSIAIDNIVVRNGACL